MEQATAIRTAREKLRMTQAHLAGAADVSKRTVIRAEQGRQISKENVLALCSVLGLSVDDLEAPAVEPKSPDGMLADMIAATGEKIVWQGVPDSKEWLRANGMGVWTRISFAVAAIPVISLAGPIWMHFKEEGLWWQGLGYDTTAVVMSWVWSLLLAIAAIRFFLDISWHHREAARLERTMHVVTDKAIYVATRDRSSHEDSVMKGEALLGDATRYALPEDRSLVHSRARCILWPPAKVLRLDKGDYRYSEKSRHKKVDIAGLQDADGLAYLIRNGNVLANEVAA